MDSNTAINMAKHIARCAASGLSFAEYARRENISLKRLYNARDRVRSRLKVARGNQTLKAKVPLKKWLRLNRFAVANRWCWMFPFGACCN